MCQKCKVIYEPEAYRRLAEVSKKTNKPYDEHWKHYRSDAENTIQYPACGTRDRPLEAPHHSYRGDGWEEQEIEGRGQELKIKVCRCGSTEWLSHFATYPEELVRRCVLAGCPPKVCPKCQRPWVRITDTSYKQLRKRGEWCKRAEDERGYDRSSSMFKYGVATKNIETFGWKPICKCGLPEADCIPGTALDPFVGTGTTCAVAKSLGRKSIGIDISEDYLRLSQYRIEQTNMPLFPITEIEL